ncbi:MAG: hypothetical protein LBE49_03935 [Deltaproteobacteria bacterium]|jgi:hypothetical protein|nr:hypothetical protein [Deltaproteobacteria bacterium]
MAKEDFALKLAREICQKLIEKRLMGASNLPGSLEWLGLSLRPLREAEEAMPALKWAGDLSLRLIEQGRARTPQTAFETVQSLNLGLRGVFASLPPSVAKEAMRTAVDLALKLLEVHFISQSQLMPAIESLANSAARALPQ